VILPFENKVGLIVGASGGIGAATARLLSSRGAKLALVARREAPLVELSAELGGALILPGDAMLEETLVQAVASVLETHGRLDFVVHAVGSIVLKPLHRLTEAEMEATFRLNTLSAFFALKAALTPMMRERSGAFVCCTSVAGQTGLANHEAVATAKAGLEGLVRAAAMTYAPYNIRVNAVAPGLTNTPLAARITGNPKALEASLGVHPLGLLGEANDVADAIAYLLGARNVTGVILPLDGGMTAGRTLGK
jgi:NAD(P)-dependent dehydrogenase (short-subunit alcohol dehydrogenase family)